MIFPNFFFWQPCGSCSHKILKLINPYSCLFPMYIYNPTVLNVNPLWTFPPFPPPLSHIFPSCLILFFFLLISCSSPFFISCFSILSLPYPTLTPFNKNVLPLPWLVSPLCHNHSFFVPSSFTNVLLPHATFNYCWTLSQISIDLHSRLRFYPILSHAYSNRCLQRPLFLTLSSMTLGLLQ